MRPNRSLAALASIVLLSLASLTACGGDSEDPPDDGTSPAAEAPADEGVDEGADEGADEGGGSSAAGFADCTAISAEEMAGVDGLSIETAAEAPGGGQCEYKPGDPNEPSVYLEQFGTDDFADGFDGAAANIASTAVGPVGDPVTTSPEGVGDDAEIVVGTSPLGSGESLQSIGLVLVGDTIVRATVLQAANLDEPTLTELTTGVLTLVAGKG